MTPKLSEGSDPNKTPQERFLERKIKAGRCHRGSRGCLTKPDEGRTICRVCSDGLKEYYLLRKAKKVTVDKQESV